MPMSVVYTTVNGQILCESRGGVIHHFVSDPLGSVVMVRDNSGNTVYEAEYDPYGNVQSETGTNPSEFGYVGALGYVKDSAFSLYVRARYLLTNLGRWLTKDPLWPSEPGFVYAGATPICLTDLTGMAPTCSNWSDSGNVRAVKGKPLYDPNVKPTVNDCTITNPKPVSAEVSIGGSVALIGASVTLCLTPEEWSACSCKAKKYPARWTLQREVCKCTQHGHHGIVTCGWTPLGKPLKCEGFATMIVLDCYVAPPVVVWLFYDRNNQECSGTNGRT